MAAFDVLVLGAGIVGCACARELAQAGLRVGVVESGPVGGGATAAGMGHLVVMDDSPAQLALSQYGNQLWHELRSQLAPSVEYETRGTLWVAADDEEMEEVGAKHARYRAAGVNSAVLDPNALAAEEPHLRGGLAGGLLVPEDAVIYPPAAAAFFLAEAIQAGAVLLRGARARASGAGIVTLNDGTRIPAGHIAVATGTDTTVVPWLPMKKRKGHLLITDRYPGLLRHQLVELGYLKSAHASSADSVAFNVQPRSTGQVLIGSSRQFDREDPAAEPSMLRRMLDRACEYMPVLSQVSGIRAWTGFRAATPDKLPYLGPTEDASVLLAMGFEGLGITHAPAAARLLASHLLGRDFAIDPAPYLPSRLFTDHSVGTRKPEPTHA